MTNEEFEPVRIRIMKEAYDLADKNDTEGYNSVKAMCGDVQTLLQRQWVSLTEDEKYDCYLKIDVWSRCVEAVEAKLKEKNG
jgi:hypothetical protein